MGKKFALLGHHLSIDLLYKNRPELKGKPIAEIKQLLAQLPPEKVADLTGVKSITGQTIDGMGLAVNLLPEQFVEIKPEAILTKIAEGINLGKRLGAGIVVLGAATAIIGNQGVMVSKKTDGVAITTGNSYTASSVIEAVKEGAKLLNIRLESANVVIIGATGSIGSACSHVLSELARSVVLVARNKKRLVNLADELSKKQQAEVSVGV